MFKGIHTSVFSSRTRYSGNFFSPLFVRVKASIEGRVCISTTVKLEKWKNIRKFIATLGPRGKASSYRMERRGLYYLPRQHKLRRCGAVLDILNLLNLPQPNQQVKITRNMEDYLNISEYGRRPQYFWKWKTTSIFLKMEDDINIFENAFQS